MLAFPSNHYRIPAEFWESTLRLGAYDNGEINCGIIQKNIKEQLGYKGIEKPYSDFKLKISKVIIGEKCSKNIVDELKRYFTNNNITYIDRLFV